MRENETFLVTGASGFIGFHMAEKLLKSGFSVVGIDNFNNYYLPELKYKRAEVLKKYPSYHELNLDLCDLEQLKSVFSDYKYSAVCHLAAQPGIRYSLENPHVYERYNCVAFLNILEMCRHSKIPRLVYASSSSVYGGNKKIPFSETDPVDNQISLYAVTKRSNELMAHTYTSLYGFQTIGLRLFTVYGPWGRPDMALWNFTESIYRGRKIKLFNFGKMKRDFTYVDDIVNGIFAALFSKTLDKYEIMNLGNHRSENIGDLVAIIEKELGKKADIELYPIQAGDVVETYADIEKASRKLGYKPETSIREGVPEFVKWYLENSSLVEKIAVTRNPNNC